MKKTMIFLFVFLSFSNTYARTIIDDYGRTVTIPDKITKIYASSPPLTISIIAFDPSLVAALNFPLRKNEIPYVGVAASKPVAGGFFGQGNTPNYEVLATIKPDVILMWGGMTGNQNALSKLNALGIPVIMVHNESINDLVGQFSLLGKLTGNTKRANALISYTKETLGLFNSLQSKVKSHKKVSYYFAEGSDGLSTECEGSFHLEPFKYAGAKNAINCKMSSDYGMEKISMEKIILSNPDVIIAMDKTFANSIHKSSKWSSLNAVKTNRVLIVPEEPFNYISRPPSLMRLMGIRWLIHSFYPNLIKPIAQEKQRFEKIFFPK
ncbi:MAG: ABC transporter substrate-binding protein [Sulfurovaceae bacterium]|nr:ABC transporter substrate-binding protein [Sulfurovaceae bacterium]MDD5548407.1 ABC transporter substrate-binding protein [Sulfurovaceae bacterium]